VAAGVRFGWPRQEQDCRICTRDTESRARWGCDAETEDPQGEFSCWRCHPFHLDPECAICGGTGVWRIHRCPLSYLEDRNAHRAIAICDQVPLLEAGVLPGPGGWHDHPASWVLAVSMVSHDRAEYERLRRRRGS